MHVIYFTFVQDRVCDMDDVREVAQKDCVDLGHVEKGRR